MPQLAPMSWVFMLFFLFFVLFMVKSMVWWMGKSRLGFESAKYSVSSFWWAW